MYLSVYLSFNVCIPFCVAAWVLHLGGKTMQAAEKQVYELETNYLSDAVQNGHGSVFKGFEGFLSHWKGSGYEFWAANFR